MSQIVTFKTIQVLYYILDMDNNTDANKVAQLTWNNWTGPAQDAFPETFPNYFPNRAKVVQPPSSVGTCPSEQSMSPLLPSALGVKVVVVEDDVTGVTEEIWRSAGGKTGERAGLGVITTISWIVPPPRGAAGHGLDWWPGLMKHLGSAEPLAKNSLSWAVEQKPWLLVM